MSKAASAEAEQLDRRPAYFPAFLDLAGRRAIVVGGGCVALSKIRLLLPCGTDPLVVIAPEVGPFIREQAERGALTWSARPYQNGDLRGAALAIGATNDRSVNAAVAAEARRRGVPVLAVDDPPNCDFISPALAQRGDLLVAVSTGGKSPAMARRARMWLEESLPEHWGALLEVAETVRRDLGPARRGILPDRWQDALGGEVDRLVADGKMQRAATMLRERLVAEK